MASEGIVFNIQRFTIHDGPGIRTELFLKGCPLRCRWCSNPESQSPLIEPGIYKSKCISHKNCGACTEVCPVPGVLDFYRQKPRSIDRKKCTHCMACVDACPSEAIRAWGERMSVEDVMKVVRRDREYYESSGGGVTLSGGEPMVQTEFTTEVLKACKEEGIQTCLESTFYTTWKNIEQVLPYTDILISDLKHMDPEVHKKYTGRTNKKILSNLKKLSKKDIPIILRIPVIPDVNDDEENIKATADFILNEMGGNVRTLQLLSFMRLGEEKYKSLDMPYGMEDVKIRRRSFQKHVQKIADYFTGRGIHCLVGTREKQ